MLYELAKEAVQKKTTKQNKNQKHLNRSSKRVKADKQVYIHNISYGIWMWNKWNWTQYHIFSL